MSYVDDDVQCCQYWPNGHADDCPLRAAPERPGGWVSGIGWVARMGDLAMTDRVRWHQGSVIPMRQAKPHGYRSMPVIVAEWADGSTPEPPKRPDTKALRELADLFEPPHPADAGLIREAADYIDATKPPKRLPDVTELPESAEVYRAALALACVDGWSDGAGAMNHYIEVARAAVDSRGEKEA